MEARVYIPDIWLTFLGLNGPLRAGYIYAKCGDLLKISVSDSVRDVKRIRIYVVQ